MATSPHIPPDDAHLLVDLLRGHAKKRGIEDVEVELVVGKDAAGRELPELRLTTMLGMEFFPLGWYGAHQLTKALDTYAELVPEEVSEDAG